MDQMISDQEGAALYQLANIAFANGWTAFAAMILQHLESSGYAVDRRVLLAAYEAYKKMDHAACDMGRHVPLSVVRNLQIFSTLHFTSNLTPHQKKVAFQSGVRYVDIETSSQCNRVCPYCPNSIYERRSGNTFMSDEVFERVVGEFAEIDFSGRISLVGLNEPLMHMDDFSKRLELVRTRLPKCRILVHTNGDYLDKPTFDRLDALKVDEIHVSVHLAPGKPYDQGEITRRVSGKAAELGLNAVLQSCVPGTSLSFSLLGSRMIVAMAESDYMKMGSNRGAVLKGVGRWSEDRRAPCIQPFDNFIVNYKGDVLLCCIMSGASQELEGCVVGNVYRESIFDIYCGEKMSAWRRHLMVEGPKASPCNVCAEQWGGFPQNWAQIAEGALADVGCPPAPSGREAVLQQAAGG